MTKFNGVNVLSLFERFQNTSRYLQALATSPERAALLVIDVQERFIVNDPCFNRIAHKINDFANSFRAASGTVYSIYYANSDPMYGERPDFKIYTPAPHEKPIMKTARSAFHQTDLRSRLKTSGHDHLLLCGFFADWCVFDTAIDSLKYGDMKPALLTDLTDFHPGSPTYNDRKDQIIQLESSQMVNPMRLKF